MNKPTENLLAKIREAQISAGEQVVIASLQSTGLITSSVPARRQESPSDVAFEEHYPAFRDHLGTESGARQLWNKSWAISTRTFTAAFEREQTRADTAERQLEEALAEIAMLKAQGGADELAAPGLPDEWIGNVVQDVAELPDRTSPDDKPDMMLVSADELRSIIAAHAPAQPQGAGSPSRWCPDACPITGLPFFMWIEHHKTGQMVPTYGGPYDSYTIPEKDDDGSYCRERYDHDRGGWLTDCTEDVGIQIVSDQAYVSVQPAATPVQQGVGEAVYWEVTTGISAKVEVLSKAEFAKRSFDTGKFRPLAYADTTPRARMLAAPAQPQEANAYEANSAYASKPPESCTQVASPITSCQAGRDGDCVHQQCPQLRDNEPHASGRHCPLDTSSEPAN